MTEPDVAVPDIEAVHRRVAERLRSVDQRYTSGRRRLVTLLAEAGRPVTLPELAAAEPGLPQSSMYRNLDMLERTGLVERINVGSDHARFELAETILGHHHHLVCADCGTIVDVTLDDDVETMLDVALAEVASREGFEAAGHRLDLHGRCADCLG